MTPTFRFAGMDYTNLFLVSSISVPFLNQKNTTQTVGAAPGVLFQRSRKQEGKVTITGTIVDEQVGVPVSDIKDRMMAGLASAGLAQLVLSNYPNRYFNAIYDGQVDYDITTQRTSGVTIAFLVPDGIAHSVATKTADNMPYKDVPVNMLKGTSDQPQTATGSDFLISTIGTFNPSKGMQYTVSVDIKQMDHNMLFQVWTMSEGARVNLIKTNVLKTAGLSSITFTAPTSDDYDSIAAQLAWTNGSDTGSYAWSKAKAEVGNIATDWSPNPADPEYYSDTITVQNDGTAPTAPVLTATMAGDNGVVAWLNDNGGVLQFGSPDEIDGVEKQKSEQVYHYTFDTAPTDVTLNDGVVAFPYFNDDPSTPNKQDGPFNYTRTPGTASPASERKATDKWSGPSMSGKLPANSAGKSNGNFEWHNRMNFATTKAANGRCEFNLTKGDQVVVSLLFYDNSRTSDLMMFEGTVNGQHLFIDSLPRNFYKDGEYDFVVTKMGDEVTFRVNRVTLGGGGVESRSVANFSASEIDGWTVWLTGYSDTPGWLMNWEDSYFNWINVDYWNDIPNRFKAGDIVTADVAHKTVSVNGAEDPTLQTIGNMWDSFVLQPGDNTLQLVTSSWADPVAAKVEYREAWY